MQQNTIIMTSSKLSWFKHYLFFFSGSAKSSGRKGSGDDPSPELQSQNCVYVNCEKTTGPIYLKF